MGDSEPFNSLISLDIQAAMEDSLIKAQAKAIRIYRAQLEWLIDSLENGFRHFKHLRHSVNAPG